jgi:CubicO group peptidase (beta-lactamase class C family)
MSEAVARAREVRSSRMKRTLIMIVLVALVFAGRGALAGNGNVPPRREDPSSQASQTADRGLNELLEPIRTAHGVPGLAAAVVTVNGLEAIGTVGVRKAGTDAAVTTTDEWHIGSDTKAMTAAMIGRLVERGKLRWDSAVGEVFPELLGSMAPALRKVTLLHLLSHRSGLPANTLWGLVPRTGTTRDQRLAVIKSIASVKLLSEPGATYLYSNLGYVIAGAMAERAADAAWEDLMRALLFEPLGMTGAGFGGVGTPGLIDQPWPHGEDGKPVEKNGPDVDNPPVMGPAGTVHLTLADWGKFAADMLRGLRGGKALLKPETYQKLRTPPFGGDYALGWAVAERDWGGGTVLTHNGSNTMNFATVWIAPARGFAVLVVCNRGGPAAFKACDEAAAKLIQWRARGVR